MIPHSAYKDITHQSLNPDSLSIGPELQLFIDRSNDVTPKLLLKREPELIQAFKGHTWLQLQLSTKPVWLSFPVEWQASDNDIASSLQLYVNMGFATLNDVTLMVLDDADNIISEQRSGDHIEEHLRPIPTSHPIFSFTIKPREQYQVLIRIDSDSFLNTSLAVSVGQQAIVTKHHLSFLLGLFYGCLGMIFFYNLFILILTRRESYLYYVLYLFFLFCYLGIFDGVIGQYLWSKPGWFLDRSLVYFAGLANLMALLFVRTILRLSDIAPKIDSLVRKFVLLISVSFIVELLYPSNFSSLWVMMTVVAFCLLVPVIGVVALKRGSLLARYYFIAWMSYPLLVGVYVLCMAGIIPTNYDTLNSLRTGSAIQAVLMSFALAYYISELRMKKSSLQTALYDELEFEVSQMSTTTRALSRGDYQVRGIVESDSRLASLAEDFNHLADALEDAKFQRERWLSDISHELRTPLTVFKGSLESMQNGIMPVNPESLQALIDESSRINRLVNDLHDLSLLESKEMSLEPDNTLLEPIIRGVISRHRDAFNEKSIAVSIRAEDSTLEAYVDADRINQVFVNLIVNTLKYTNSPGELSIMLNRVGDKILIRWMDSEPGVNVKDLAHLFDRLYRTDTSRNRKSGGAGLGLSLCLARIEKSGGTIVALPSALGGVQIDLTLPQAPESDNE